MAVKAGYKRTEVGVIPEDWEVKPLHVLAAKIMVGIASAATHAYRIRGVVMFRNQNIKPGHLDDRDVLHIDEAYEETYKNKRLKAGDLLTARTGYPGTTCIVPSKYEGAQSFTTLITRPHQDLVSSDYLCHFINSEPGQNYFEKNQIGGGQKNVNAGSLKNLAIPFPPIKAEQEAIAEALSDADALIESLEQLLVKKRQLKQGVMQELLTGKKRLPGFEVKSGYKQSEVGEIPADWNVANIGDEFSIQLGKMLDSEKNVGVLKPFLGNRAVQWGRFDLSNIGVVRMTHSDLQRFRLRHGDLLVCEGGEIGRCAIWNEPLEECYYQKALHRLRPKRGFNATLMLNILRRLATSGFLLNFVTQTSIAHLPKDKLEAVPIPLPPNKSEQEAIATILSDMDAEAATLEAKITKARQLKQGMMQELLTGRIRLV
jgi:type I restriction enzyme S subunit